MTDEQLQIRGILPYLMRLYELMEWRSNNRNSSAFPAHPITMIQLVRWQMNNRNRPSLTFGPRRFEAIKNKREQRNPKRAAISCFAA
jgi:hypothetical protein